MINLLRQHLFFKDKEIESCTRLAHQGYCNENYLLVTKNKKYIVRKLLRTDIDRSFEYTVQLLAFDNNIAAEPLVFDEKNAFMVFAFLEGGHKSTLEKDDLKHLAHTLCVLHNIKIDSSSIELYVEHQTDEVRAAFEALNQYPKEYVLCHNDLNPKNIFFTDTVKLIDFEYAGVNDKYFDLACVCVEFGLTTEEEQTFLRHYANEYNEKKLHAYKTIYTALCKEWFENHCTTDIIKS